MQSNQVDEMGILLDNLFPDYPEGFFLEIGAWDANHLSQSLYLERVKGWKGLCVDPFPRGFENRTCSLCTKAISADGQPREFVRVTTDRRDGGDVSYFSGFRDSIRFHWDTIEQFCDYYITTVDTITIPELYKQYQLPQYIEFLSVDVEGAEVEVFCGIDFDICKFGVIVFEHNMDNNVRRYIGRLLDKHGYKLTAETLIDDIYT